MRNCRENLLLIEKFRLLKILKSRPIVVFFSVFWRQSRIILAEQEPERKIIDLSRSRINMMRLQLTHQKALRYIYFINFNNFRSEKKKKNVQ
jgi:hypothetical protein